MSVSTRPMPFWAICASASGSAMRRRGGPHGARRRARAILARPARGLPPRTRPRPDAAPFSCRPRYRGRMLRLIAVVLIVTLATLTALCSSACCRTPSTGARGPAGAAAPDVARGRRRRRRRGRPRGRRRPVAGRRQRPHGADGRRPARGPAALEALLAHGADVDWRAADGMTALMLALRHARTSEVPLLLLNAGADPTLTDAAGQRRAALRGSEQRGAQQRPLPAPAGADRATVLHGLAERVRRAGAGLDAEFTRRALAGAPRAYRNGIHEGFDFYDGAVSGAPIAYGTAIVAMASGTVIRADHGYVEMTRAEYDEVIQASRTVMVTPEDMLDRLRGMQVWLEHPGGFVTRYAHLSGIPPEVQVGARVDAGPGDRLHGQLGHGRGRGRDAGRPASARRDLARERVPGSGARTRRDLRDGAPAVRQPRPAAALGALSAACGGPGGPRRCATVRSAVLDLDLAHLGLGDLGHAQRQHAVVTLAERRPRRRSPAGGRCG
jgi:hypothetical protein